MDTYNESNEIMNWKESLINVDSLWIIDKRDKNGKHCNIYHGNFVPQIPNQLINRYTKEKDIVVDLFMGSGTTLYECENLNRNFIGFDINDEIISFVNNQMKDCENIDYIINNCDVTNKTLFSKKMKQSLKHFNKDNIDFFIAHPPYFDIIKFTDKEEDLSNIKDLDIFINKFVDAMQNVLSFLSKDKYFAIVVGDIYKKSEVIPLGFYLMNVIKTNFKVKMKGIIVKNIEGNRGKLGTQNIWKYRALKSDYYLFKHEYIFVFKKDF